MFFDYRRLLCIAIILCCVSLTGCAAFEGLRGPGYQGEDATWGSSMRRENRGKGRFGIDRRAQQIEKSLGID